MPTYGALKRKGESCPRASGAPGAGRRSTAQGIPLTRVHAPKAFGYHVSKLRHTEVETIETGKQGLSVSNPDGGNWGFFGMTPLVRGGKSFANVGVGAVLPKGFVDRAKQRFGIDRAVHSFGSRIVKKLSSSVALTDLDAQGNAQGNAAGFRARQV